MKKTTVRANRLFEEPMPDFHLPQLHQHYLDDALDEMELLGFTLCHPFDLVDDAGKNNYVPAVQMQQHLGKKITMLGYLVTLKYVHTIKNELMYFGTFIDGEGSWIDTVHFPDSLKFYPLQGKGFYRMTGVVVEEFGVYNLEVHQLEKVGIKGRNGAKPGISSIKKK